jgi:ferrous iron transport protein B
MESGKDILESVELARKEFLSRQKIAPEKIIAQRRYQTAEKIAELAVKRPKEIKDTITDRIDRIVCHKYLGPVILLAVIYLFYELAIVQGYKATAYTWPILAALKDLIASVLPAPGFIFDPLLRSVFIGVIDGIFAVLNYIPIFIILFTLIAIMEDTGYMARVAFILDRIFRHFGLHGQSALPMILSGVFVGGCAIPGVLSCRSIKDEKARLATILICPLMNCLAKTPLYILLIGMFFAAYKGLMMFFIATITIIIALSVTKILSLTLLRRTASAPFVLEMPSYHIPTIGAVLRRCVERLWLFVKKIMTIVVVFALVVYLLLSVPGISEDRKAYYQDQAGHQVEAFFKKIGNTNPYAKLLEGQNLTRFANYWDDYRKAKMGAGSKEAKEAVDKKFRERDGEFFKIVKRGKYEVDGKRITDSHAMKVEKAYKKLTRERNRIKRDIGEETVVGSIMGRLGIWLEPVTQYAGFNWRINIGLVSAFAAKENIVATMGSIYKTPPGEAEKTLETRMKEKETGWTPLHALAVILFMTMYPPCIPAMLSVRLESGSTKWMLFAMFYPVVLGSIFAVLVFTGGNMIGLSGIQAMIVFYVCALVVTAVLGFIKDKNMSEDYG